MGKRLYWGAMITLWYINSPALWVFTAIILILLYVGASDVDYGSFASHHRHSHHHHDD